MKPRILSTARLSFPLAAALAALLAAPATHAALTWDNTAGGAINDGAGAWLGAGLWNNGSPSATWADGSDAIFGNGGAGGAVTLTGPVAVNSLTFNAFTGTYTLGTAAQTITLNTTGLTMNSGAGAVSFAGPVTLGAAQTWTNYSASTLGFANGTTTVDNGGNLLTLKNGIFNFAMGAGFGGVTLSGAGGLTLDGARATLTQPTSTTNAIFSYTGTTTLTNGASILHAGNLSGGNITLNGGYVESYFGTNMTRTLGSGAGQIQLLGGVSGFCEQGSGSTVTINNLATFEVVWGASGEAGNGLSTGFFNPSTLLLQANTANSGKTITFANLLDLNGTTRTIEVDKDASTAATISNVIRTSSGTAGLTKIGVGKLILSGANTFNGPVTVNAGILSVGSLNTVANANPLGKSSAAAANLLLANGTTLQFTGAAASCDRSFTLNGTAAGDAITLDASGSGALNLSSTSSPAYGTSNQTRTLNLTGSNTGNNILAAALADNGSGALSITKTGAGLWALSGTNTYTGPTTVKAGTLSLTGSLSGTAITTIGGIINESATGAIGGAVSFTQAGGSGTSILSGTNTYSGMTTVFTGTVQFSKQISLYNNTPASWTAANINVKSLATLALNVDSAGTAGFTSGNLNTLLGNISVANTASEGLQSGAFLGLDTSTATGSTFTQGNLIADTTGTNGGVLGLAKLGAGTLILDKTNTYTGRTLISGGILQLGAGGTTGSLSTSSVIVNNGNLTINRNNAVAQGTDFSATPITGTGSFTQAGSGNTTLSAANTFSGTTTVSAGTLTLTNALALQNSALVISGTGVVDITGVTTPTFGGLSGSTNLSALTGYTGVTALTISPSSGSATYSGVISDSTPGMTLTKNGAGTQILTGANTYTGLTTINFGTLTIGNGTAGSLNGTTGTALTFGGTGTFNVAEANGSSQGMGALTFSVGAGTVTSTAANATATQTVTFASMAARPVGATGNFTLATNLTAAQNKIVLTDTTNAPPNNSGSNNPGLFFGGTEYARYDTTNNYFRAVAYGTDNNAPAIVTTAATLGIDDATKDVKISGAITAQTTASVNTLNLAALTLTLSSTAQVLSVNGILSNGGTIATAGKIQPATAGGELVINTAGNLTLNPIIQNNTSASSLTKSGTGTLTLNSNASTYSGGTVVNAGTVTTATGGGPTVTFFGSGLVTVNPGATLGLNNTYVGNNVTLNSATVTAGNSFGSTMAGSTITLNGISTVNITGNLTISGNMTGTGGLIKTGGSNVPVTGTNTYTGTTTISAGPLTFSKAAALYNGTTASWTPANITVASGATLGVNYGGASDFTNSQVTTLLGNLTTGISNNGLLAGSAVAFDTTNGNGAYSGNITDSTGAGGGSVGVNKIGANTLTLSGNNTFSGPASVGGPSGTSGGTLAVYSFNSVNGGSPTMANSSLGRPTTVANGTITCGNGSSNQSVGLTYLGTGETTDRVLALNAGVNGTALTLDQSGTGLLKFTSAVAYQGATGSRVLVLQGSTAGTGEMAGALTDPVPYANSLGITKQGTGTWTLSGTNTYFGVTTISGGALVLASTNALPGGTGTTGGISALTFTGGVLGLGTGDFTRNLAAAGTVTGVCFTGNGGWAAYGADRVVNLGVASATVTWATANTGLNGKTLILGNTTATHTVDFQNPLDLGNAARTVQVDNGAAAIDGKLTGILSGAGGGLTMTGLGTLLLTNTNSYTGATAVQAGTLVAGTNAPSASNGALGNASSEVNLGVAGGNNNAGILIGGAFDFGRIIRLLTNNTTDTGTRVLILGGTTAHNSTFSGNIILGTTSQAGRGVTLTAASGGQVTFSGVIQNPATMDATTYTVTKEGLGTVVLSNANTYTGATAVNAGALFVNGAQPLATGDVSVAANATLGGTGTIGGNTTIADTGKLEFNLSTVPGSHDKLELAATKALTFGANASLTITSSGGATTGDYTLLTAPGGIGALPTFTLSLPVGWSANVTRENSNTDLVLHITSLGGSAYDTWATLKGLDGTPGKDPAKGADPDNDGKNNLAEFAFDGNPLSGANDGKIVGKVATVGGNQVMTLTLPVRGTVIATTFSDSSGDELSVLVDGIYYRIEGDANLSTFANDITEVGAGAELTAIQAGLPGLSSGAWTYRTFRAPGTVPATPKAFLRCKVSETP